ncbi:MAG TPA: MFS transporter [Spirochaetota bacterium]|nr:MFS transporter [Spirochaetota bacterium]HPJ34694.1 MFS transporter [Spirochaetota bacterium]
MDSESEYSIDHYFWRNTFSISSVELCWGLAIPVLFESTFLQIFLREIGASNLIVGLIPAILSMGIMLFSLMSAYLTSHLERKKMWVILSHIFASLPLILFGAMLTFTPSGYRVALFLVCYSTFSLMLGLTVPMWQNFTVMIFSPGKALRGISIMIAIQITTRLIGGLTLFKVVEKYSFSTGSASIIFISAGLLCFAGSFFFLPAKEVPAAGEGDNRKRHSIHSIIESAGDIIHNRRYITYMAGSIEIYATTTVIAFYANYAVEWRGIEKSSAAGLFVSSIYLAGIFINILIGWLDLFRLKTKFLIARGAALCGTIIIMFAPGLLQFLTASFLIGISRGINQSAHVHAVKKLSGLHDATDYFAISLLFLFPFSAGIPFVSGMFLDITREYGDTSYIIMFSALALIQAGSLLITAKSDFGE